MTVTIEKIEREILPDENPNVEHLKAKEFAERYYKWRHGVFNYIGIRAKAILRIPTAGGKWITQEITSPGIWGIEDDSGEEYFEETYQEELSILISMLGELGVSEFQWMSTQQ